MAVVTSIIVVIGLSVAVIVGVTSVLQELVTADLYGPPTCAHATQRQIMNMSTSIDSVPCAFEKSERIEESAPPHVDHGAKFQGSP